MDRWTDGQTDTVTYRVVCTRLKTYISIHNTYYQFRCLAKVVSWYPSLGIRLLVSEVRLFFESLSKKETYQRYAIPFFICGNECLYLPSAPCAVLSRGYYKSDTLLSLPSLRLALCYVIQRLCRMTCVSHKAASIKHCQYLSTYPSSASILLVVTNI